MSTECRNLWDERLLLDRHIYIGQRTQFQLAQSRPESWEMLALEKGLIVYSFGGQQIEATSNCIVLHPPDVLMRREVLEPISFHFFAFALPDRPPDAQLQPGDPVGTFTPRDTQRLASTFAYLRWQFQQQRNPQLSRETHYLRDILHLIGVEQTQRQQGSRPHDPLMEQARLWLEEHAATSLKLHQLAGVLSLSPAQLTRRFQAAYGQTPSDFVSALRLQRAQALLVTTDLTLDLIAEQCGYESRFYLSRIFSRKLGMTPTTFRKRRLI